MPYLSESEISVEASFVLARMRTDDPGCIRVLLHRPLLELTLAWPGPPQTQEVPRRKPIPFLCMRYVKYSCGVSPSR